MHAGHGWFFDKYKPLVEALGNVVVQAETLRDYNNVPPPYESVEGLKNIQGNSPYLTICSFAKDITAIFVRSARSTRTRFRHP